MNLNARWPDGRTCKARPRSRLSQTRKLLALGLSRVASRGVSLRLKMARINALVTEANHIACGCTTRSWAASTSHAYAGKLLRPRLGQRRAGHDPKNRSPVPFQYRPRKERPLPRVTPASWIASVADDTAGLVLGNAEGPNWVK